MSVVGDYDWLQLGHVGDDVSGCALGVRKGFGELSEPRAVVGSMATSEGREVTGHGIGTRLILRGRVTVDSVLGSLSFRAVAGHAPPERSPNARAAFMRVFARIRAKFKGGDLNLAGRVVHRLLGRRVIGDGVLWLVLPRLGWQVVSRRIIDVDGDHSAVLATVRHRRTGITVRILVINAMSVSTGPRHAARIFANGLDLEPDIVIATECADFRAVDVDLARARRNHRKDKRR